MIVFGCRLQLGLYGVALCCRAAVAALVPRAEIEGKRGAVQGAAAPPPSLGGDVLKVFGLGVLYSQVSLVMDWEIGSSSGGASRHKGGALLLCMQWARRRGS